MKKKSPLATQLDVARVKTGFSQKDLAKRAGIREATASRVFNEPENCGMATLIRICEAMGAKIRIE